MEMHVTGQSVLGELRQYVLSALFGNPLFTEAEQLRANHFVHECEDIARLTRWHANVLAEITRRAQAAARHRGRQTLSATLNRLCSTGFRGHQPRSNRPRPAATWVLGTPPTDRADRRAGTFDRQAAARFQPAHTLTYVQLLSR